MGLRGDGLGVRGLGIVGFGRPFTGFRIFQGLTGVKGLSLYFADGLFLVRRVLLHLWPIRLELDQVHATPKP